MASKSLGTLTLDLIARTGGFVQGMSKAERESAKWRKQVEKDVATVGKALGGAAAAVVAGTSAIVVSSIKSAGEISRLAQVSNVSTEAFQRYAAGASVLGIEQQKLGDIFKDTNDKLGEFLQTGSGPVVDFFEKIAPKVGVTAEQFRNLSGPDALQLYASSLEKANVSQGEMTFYMEALANDATVLIPLLKNGGEGFRLLGDEAQRAGAIMSAETITAAEELSAATYVAEQAAAGLKNQIAESLLPVLSDFAVGLSDVAVDGALAEDIAGTLATTLKALAAAALGSYAGIQLLGKGVAGVGAVTNSAFQDAEWWEKIIPPFAAKRLYDNWSAVETTAGVVADDLDATAQRYATILNKIWSAGENSGSGETDSENRIKRIAEFLREAREAAGTGKGEFRAASEEAEKAAQAIADQIKGLETAAITVGMTADEIKLYTLAQQGASDADQLRAANALRVVAAYEAQADAAKLAREEQAKLNSEAMSIAESLLTEEEALQKSYERRRQIILDNTKVTGEAQGELLRRLDEKYAEERLAVSDDFWERYLASAQENLTSLDELSANMLENFSSSVGQAFEAMVFDAETLNESLQSMAEGLARSVVAALGEMAAQWLAYQAVQMLVGKTTQASAASTMTFNAMASQQMAAINAFASTAAIPIVGPALAPGASLAAIAATSPMVGAVASLSLAGMAHEGIDRVPKTGTWLLEEGERVTTAETSAKLDRTLEDVRRGGTGAGTVVNVNNAPPGTEVRSRRGPDGKEYIDVFVADLMSDGPAAKAIQRAYGMKRAGR